ncbi:MBL fold metallo-hydrolase [Sulfuricaulis sp.]|uniref:MBL fold metallo-hydrolase n=1 Tax=Sulfuricaulis sp. TaxID=2003553 RepID=UPI00355A2045
MFFRQKTSKDSTLSYLFGCGGLGKAVAVDVVAGDEEWFVEEASKAKSAITHVIDTHVHADHYSGGRKLALRVGAQYCLHASAPINFPCLLLNDRDVIEAGNVQVTVLHTPGHTLDSVCLLVTDMRRGPEPWFLLTGDTLFVGGVGRPDLTGREYDMAGMLFDSLHRKLLMLPEHLEFFPGHQAGSMCGSGLSGKPSSTLGFEKRCNPLLAITDKEQFIRQITSKLPPRTAEMGQIVLINTAA